MPGLEPLIGTPEEVSGRMGQAIEEIGGDDFLIRPGFSGSAAVSSARCATA